MCFLTLAALIAYPIFAQSQATDTPVAAQDLRQTALGFRNAQDFDKAIETYKALLAQNPTDTLSIKVDLGLCYKAKKDYANAMPLFTEVASSQDKRKAESMFFIEDCCCEQGKIADAVAELTVAYNECPEARTDFLLRRAARQCDIQKYKEALADYQEFLAKYPDKTDLIATFSARLPEIKLRATGLFDGPASGLETEWTRAKGDGSDPVYANLVACRLGLACKSGQDYRKAIAIFEDLAKDAQGDRCRELTFWALDCLTEQDKNEDALAYLDKMLAAHPDWKYLIDYRCACCLSELARPEEAIAGLNEYLAETPDTEFAKNVEVMIANITLAAFGKPDEARSLLEKVIADHPDYPGMIEARSLVANCAYDKQNYAEAAELHEAAFGCPEYGTFKSFIQYMIGDCYAQIADYTNAFQAWGQTQGFLSE